MTYDGLNADKIRNALTHETDREVLASFATDIRKRVSEKATARLRALDTEEDRATADRILAGVLNKTDEQEEVGGIEPNHQHAAGEHAPGPAEQSPSPEAGVTALSSEAPALPDARPRKRTSRRKNLDASPTVPTSASPEGGAELLEASATVPLVDATTADGHALPPVGDEPPIDAKPKRQRKVKEPKPRKVRQVWTNDSPRVCPRCGETKPVGTGFGWRKLPLPLADGGGTYQGPQPHCTPCRRAASKLAARQGVREKTRQQVADKLARRQAREQAKAEARALKDTAPVAE